MEPVEHGKKAKETRKPPPHPSALTGREWLAPIVMIGLTSPMLHKIANYKGRAFSASRLMDGLGNLL